MNYADQFEKRVIEFNKRSYTVNMVEIPGIGKLGFLANFKDWDKNWAELCRQDERIENLNNEHWSIIDSIQEYYKKNKIPPMIKNLSIITGFTIDEIKILFPTIHGIGACRMAGMPFAMFYGCS